MANYQGQATSWGGFTLHNSQITQRVVELVIRAGSGSPAQHAAINAAIQRAQSLGVQLTVITIP
jgi:hypothetical protein